MITTIQLHEEVKKDLDKLKTDKETYEEVIIKMIRILEKQKRNQKTLLKESYQEMAQESKKTTYEWETAGLDWE